MSCQKDESVCENKTCTRIWTSSYTSCPDPKTGQIKIQTFLRDTMVETNVCDPDEWLQTFQTIHQAWEQDSVRQLLPKNECFCH